MTHAKHAAFIFARGGSKGVKNKNIREVAGKPLIAHTINTALQSKYIDRVFVSTDDENIKFAAQEHGAHIIDRPSAIAQDDTPEILAWRHAIEAQGDLFTDKDSLFLSLPATSPMRNTHDINAGIEKYLEGSCDILFGITNSKYNPYLTATTIDENDHLKLFMENSGAFRRQDTPKVYGITGCIYVASPSYILSNSHLMEGKVGYIEIPEHRALDIDTEYDLYLADLLLSHPYEAKGNH